MPSGGAGDAAVPARGPCSGTRSTSSASAVTEPKPNHGSPGTSVAHPPRDVRALHLEVAGALARSGAGRLELVGEHVHPGVRGVGEAAHVVEVEVGQRDVGDLARVVTQGADLGDRGLGGVEDRADHRAERPPRRLGSAPSAAPKPVSTSSRPSRPLDQGEARPSAGSRAGACSRS